MTTTHDAQGHDHATAVPDTAGVIAPPPLIPICYLLLGTIMQRLLPTLLLPQRVRRMGRVAGGVLIATAAAGAVWSGATMSGAETPISPTKPVQRIVSTGPFAYSRNPIYVSFNLLYLGIAALTNNRWPVLLWPAMVATLQAGVIAREERYLEAKFGDEYHAYARRVRRWI